MTAWLDNERLSAYLDGELSPQERQIVEKLLASDSAARQLVEELRAQRELIRQLPRFPIPRDLSRSVIALAEERRA
ncbi:MAG TPA: zf-HC2 domain-containing protein, partial [Thermogutta sp.]|nr:zf-HC2 domain-containing protein [Thermogutta sp.]